MMLLWTSDFFFKVKQGQTFIKSLLSLKRCLKFYCLVCIGNTEEMILLYGFLNLTNYFASKYHVTFNI